MSNYSNSPLVCYTLLSPNHSGLRNHKIDTVTIHCMAGNLSIEVCGKVFQNKERQASSNYGIGSDGRIGLYVEEKNRSWCTSSSANDNRAITIEVANDGNEKTGWHVSDKALKALIELLTDICKRNNIKELKWSTNKTERMQHLNGCNLTVHRDYANKACPGDYLYNKHFYISDEVNKKLKGEVDIDMTKEELKAFIEQTVKEMGRGEPASAWAWSGIEEAKKLGITDASDPQAFATRQEVMLMAKRASEIKE